MIRHTASHRRKKIVTRFERLYIVVKICDGTTSYPFQGSNVRLKFSGVTEIHACIGAKSRKNRDFIRFIPQLLVKIERIRWVVRCTDDFHIHALQQSAYPVFGRLEFFLSFIKYAVRGIWIQQFSNAKIAL